jgi:hypothetical protein
MWFVLAMGSLLALCEAGGGGQLEESGDYQM